MNTLTAFFTLLPEIFFKKSAKSKIAGDVVLKHRAAELFDRLVKLIIHCADGKRSFNSNFFVAHVFVKPKLYELPLSFGQ